MPFTRSQSRDSQAEACVISLSGSGSFNCSEDTDMSEDDEYKANKSESAPSNQELNDTFDENSCAICLEEMIHPVQTPCKHCFCFLCLKGVSLTNGNTCPMCRQSIPSNFFWKPQLLTPPSVKRKRTKSSDLKSSSVQPQVSSSNEEKFQWYYKGMNGWWRYDARTNKEIEEASKEGKSSINLLIAGHNFKIDLKGMYQQKADGNGLMRDIKRSNQDLKAKGTAGLYSSSLATAGTSKENNRKKK